MGRYTFEISSDPIWWTINSVDKPSNIQLTFTPITIQNVNWIDSFNISFIADKNTYTYLKITDTATTDTQPPYYYYLETTSKKLTQGFECRGKLDVWATFLGGIGTGGSNIGIRFERHYDYPVYVDRFLNTNKKCLETYYNSSSYLQKDEFFDYSQFPLTTNPNKWTTTEIQNTARNTNMFCDTFFKYCQVNIYNYGLFQTSVGADYRSFAVWNFHNPSVLTDDVIRKYYNAVPYLILSANNTNTASPSSPDLIGILFQPSTDDSVYRLVICANKNTQYLAFNCNAHYNGSTSNDPDYGGKVIYNSVTTSGYACIKLDTINSALPRIFNEANDYVYGGAVINQDTSKRGYWRDKVIGVFKMDFLELLSITGFTFTTYNVEANYNNGVINRLTSNSNGTTFSGTLPTKEGILFKDFNSREWLKVQNQIKWRHSTYKLNNQYWTWNGSYKDTYNNIDTDFSLVTTKSGILEKYKRIDDNNYLLRYPMSRISIDNYCMSPFFGVWIQRFNYIQDQQENNYGYGWLDSPLSGITFDGNKWLLIAPYKDSFIYTTDFTQASYTLATDGYMSYLNAVKSQQDAALRVAQANAIFKTISSIVFGGAMAATGIFSGNLTGGVQGIAGGINGPIEGWMDYWAQDQNIEAQRQDQRRSATAHVVQAGNTQAMALNLARQLIDTSDSPSANGTGWMVRAPLSISDIQYYNSLVWHMGIKAGFNIPIGCLVNQTKYLEGIYVQRIDNPFTYFQIKDLPEPLIRKWYPNLQNDYVQAIKAVFAGGVRMWGDGFTSDSPQLTGNNENDAFNMRWDLENR